MIRRELHVQTSLKCCRNGEIVYSPQPRQFIYYQEKMYFLTTLEQWKINKEEKFREKIKKAAEDECNSLGTPILCDFEFKVYDIKEEVMDMHKLKILLLEYEKERQQELIKREEKKKKAETAKAIRTAKEQKEKEQKIEKIIKEEEKISEELKKRGIEYIPKPLPIKKELSAIDITHIVRIQKNILKLEKKKTEQQQFLNVALESIKRIKEIERLDLLLGQLATKDRFLDEINRTNIKIERQQKAIQKIKEI